MSDEGLAVNSPNRDETSSPGGRDPTGPHRDPLCALSPFWKARPGLVLLVHRWRQGGGILELPKERMEQVILQSHRTLSAGCWEEPRLHWSPSQRAGGQGS